MARFAQIKASGFNSEDATNINMVTQALKAAGIVAVDQTGQLRNFGDVINELMSKWKGLDENTKRYVATTLGGTFQLNRFITLMENADDVAQNYAYAMDSAGAANKKYAIYLESIQAKMNKLKATMEGFWQKTINIAVISGVVDALNLLVIAVGNVETAIGLLVGAILILKAEAIGTLVSKILPALISGFYALADALTFAALGLISFETAIPIIGAVLAIISLVAVGINLFTASLKKSTAATDTASDSNVKMDGTLQDSIDLLNGETQALDETTASLDKYLGSVDTLSAAYSKLHDGEKISQKDLLELFNYIPK